MLCRICWKNPNGKTETCPPIDEKSAQAWLIKCQETYPTMQYWIVPVEEKEC